MLWWEKKIYNKWLKCYISLKIKIKFKGCPRDRAIKYCSKGFCKIDITKKYEGPEGY